MANHSDDDSVTEVTVTAAFRPPAFNLQRLLSSNALETPPARTTPRPPTSAAATQSAAPTGGSSGSTGPDMHHALPGRVASDDSSGDAPGHGDGSKKPKKSAKTLETKPKKKSKKAEQPKDADHDPIQDHDDDDDNEDDLLDSDECEENTEAGAKAPRKRPASKGSRATKKPASRGKKRDDHQDEEGHESPKPFEYAIEKKDFYNETVESSPPASYHPDNQLGLEDSYQDAPGLVSDGDSFGAHMDPAVADTLIDPESPKDVADMADGRAVAATGEEPYLREFSSLPSVGMHQERSDEILDTMLAEVENDEEEMLQNLLEACSDLEEESREPGADVDDHGGDDGDSKTGLSPASSVRNLELNSEEYMECLVDDRMAEADAQMMADSDGDLSDRINAGFRALDRHDMGLRPVAKKTAKKPAKKPAVKPAAKPRGRPASSSKSSSKSRRAAPATTPKRRAAPGTAPKSRAEKSHAKKNKKVNQPKPKNKAKKVKKDENALEKKLHSVYSTAWKYGKNTDGLTARQHALAVRKKFILDHGLENEACARKFL